MRYNYQQGTGYMVDIPRFVASASLLTLPIKCVKSSSCPDISNLQFNIVILRSVAVPLHCHSRAC